MTSLCGCRLLFCGRQDLEDLPDQAIALISKKTFARLLNLVDPINLSMFFEIGFRKVLDRDA